MSRLCLCSAGRPARGCGGRAVRRLRLPRPRPAPVQARGALAGGAASAGRRVPAVARGALVRQGCSLRVVGATRRAAADQGESRAAVAACMAPRDGMNNNTANVAL